MTTMQRTLTSLSLLLALSGLTAGCGDGGPAGTAKLLVQGRVEANLDRDATTVTAHVIAEDGSREPVAMEPTATDGSGRYRIESDAELRADTNIVLDADDGSEHAAVVLTVDADGEMTAEPMNEETTLEAAVFESLATSATCEDCSHAAVRAAVEAEAAATYESAGPSEATLADVSATIAARIEAEASVLREDSASAFEAYVEARAEAQTQEAEALDAATNASATAEAHAQYDQAIANAQAESSYTAETWAASAHAAAEATRMEASSVSLEATLYAQLVADAEQERAASVHAAMEAELAAAGVTDVSLDATFAALEIAIDDARGDGAAAGDSIASAWADAAVSLRAEISGSLDGVVKTAFDGWATFSTTLVATLRADAALGGTGSVASAVMLGGGLGDISADVTALTSAGMDSATAAAFASVLLHAELAASAQ
ncbi:MAG: hypothetical protein R3B40_32425 [Polyangiales bacterium]|nr:hypothetical protein [Sandaracinaceae bacterium]